LAGQIVEWVLRVLVAVVLAATGSAKAFQPEIFSIEVDRFQLTPWWLSVVLGYFLPWFEVVTAITLFCRPLYLGALLAVSGLGMVFAVAVGSAWWRGLDISCGCFGALVSGHVNAWHILSSLLFVGVGSALLVYNGRLRKKPTAMDGKRP
jgi:putative oxidoreductase